MPVERRDVLSSFGEMSALLGRVAGRYAADIPGTLSSSTIIEVLHTRDDPRAFHDKRRRMLALLREAPKGDGAIFRATKPAAVKGERTFAFFVPENVMLDILIGECASLKIALPRRANKLVVAEDLSVGLRLVVDDNGLKLETP
jgi:hypothetical protein